ncbi:MAG: type II toxin-antitoxin system Phd/YefM family antitoxin [Gemmatimonadales bacterium]
MIKTASISELKARLSAYLDVVRQGDEVLVTDRGRLIARLTPVQESDSEGSRREQLLRSGQLRAPSAPLPADFFDRAPPLDPEGRSLAVLLEERGEGL